jgi:hypothetical protein
MEHVIPAIEEQGGTIDDVEAFCGWWKSEHAAAATATETRAACGCQGANTMTIAERVTALLKKAKSPFTEQHRSFLETCSEDQLMKLESVPEPKGEPKEPPKEEPKPETPEERAAAVKKAVADAMPKTEEDWMKIAPQSLRDAVKRQQAADSARQTELLAALKDNGVYTEEELKEMSLETLERTDKLAAKNKPVDFTVLGGRPRETNEEDKIPAAPSLTDRIRTARGIKTA